MCIRDSHKIEHITSDAPVQAYDVVGPICASSDVFGKAIDLNGVKRGALDVYKRQEFVYFVPSFYVPVNDCTAAVPDYIHPFSACLLYTSGFPIVRTEGYMKETAQVQMSPFRYFL